jgi:NAD(P)-dependent dehydrogenase (short-subunit alcohol dehydrogenase family)
MKILAITGGGQGIGRGIVFRFAQSGYAVSITDCDEKAGREAAARAEALGAQALFVRTDVGRERDVEN